MPANFSIGFTALNGFSFVVLFFAATDSDFEFDAVIFEKGLERNERDSGSFRLVLEFINFLTIKQEFSLSLAVFLVLVFGLVGSDQYVFEPGFVAPNRYVTAFEIELFGSNGFNFVTFQNDAGLHGFENFVVKKGFFVLRKFHGMIIA